jgi:hypothetical protein
MILQVVGTRVGLSRQLAATILVREYTSLGESQEPVAGRRTA